MVDADRPHQLGAVTPLDIGAAAKTFGLKMSVGLQDALDRTLAWYRGTMEQDR